jgi:hypothetical protein
MPAHANADANFREFDFHALLGGIRARRKGSESSSLGPISEAGGPDTGGNRNRPSESDAPDPPGTATLANLCALAHPSTAVFFAVAWALLDGADFAEIPLHVLLG